MAKITFENLTVAQAKMFSDWFEGQGEQDADVWFDENGVPTPMTDMLHKGGWRKIRANGDVVVYCRS